jgi:long-chain acyl-CoA synthetase
MTLLTDHLQLGPVNFDGRTYAPEFVMGQIDAVARYLDRHCTARSPIVYLVATNHPKTVAGYFGIIKSGRVCLLVDPASRSLEWAEMTRDAPPSAIIRFDRSSEALELEREIELHDGIVDSDQTAELDRVCTMLFTAADDGYAKAAMLTHDNMLANARSVVECNRLDATTPSCSLSPLAHLFAVQSGLVAPALAGSPICIVVSEPLVRLRAAVCELRAAQVARLQSVPIVFYLLGKVWSQQDSSSIPQVLVSGGAKLPSSVSRHYRQTLGRQIHEGYGLTEAAPICSWHHPTDRIRPESVGRAISGCQISIQDQVGRALPVGTVGEVCARGPNVMKGYFRHPEATEVALRRGWLHTGDVGRLDQDGYLYLTGLKKRMINAAGKKVYPAEVERLMRLYTDLEDVAIWGEPEEIRGEVVTGRVRLRRKSAAMEQAFRNWCSQHISAYKIPSRIEFE